MNAIRSCRRAWLGLVLCLPLLLVLVAGVTRAEEKGGGKCEGTKEQRKQKMELREITDKQFQQMIERYRQELSAEFERLRETGFRRLQRKYDASRETGEPFVYDVLVISGGGAKGAFGAGFFQGWGEVEPGPLARPEFDMVTGVSTGALLAPFAFLGGEEDYARAAEFYANPKPNWVTKRGAIKFLPSHVSMFNNCHLQDTIRNVMNPAMIKALGEASAEDRLLLIEATNLDTGSGRVFDLGWEARRAAEEESWGRIADILLASSAIPAVFPPIEIDGMLYADGGATSNLFITAFPGAEGVLARFLVANPGAAPPKVRIWVVVNQHLKPAHVVTQPRWVAISGRALDTLTSSSQLFALAIIRDMVHEARVERGVDAELRLVSIPDDAPRNATGEMFDRDYMRALEELGRKIGADPSRWSETIPSALDAD